MSQIQLFSQEAILDSAFQKLHENRLFNGVALVCSGDEILLHKAYGLANVEWEIPLDTESVFEIGSVSKQFTALLIMQLVEEGKMRLEDKVSDYIELPEGLGDSVTIHHLLTHTSGLPDPDSRFEDYLLTHARIKYSMKERISHLKGMHLISEPGKVWSYYGFGYSLLLEMALDITGLSMEELYGQRIFALLNMESSGCYLDKTVLKKRAYGYEMDLEQGYKQAVYFAKTPAKMGAGGLYATTGDLLKWCKGLTEHRLLSESSQNRMFQPHFMRAENKAYGYGFYWEELDIQGVSYVGVFHGGSVPGTSSLVFLLPEKDLYIILLHNTAMGRENYLHMVALSVMRYLEGEPLVLPAYNVFFSMLYEQTFGRDEDMEGVFDFFAENNRDSLYLLGPQQFVYLYQYGAEDRKEETLLLGIQKQPDHYLCYWEMAKYYQGMKKLGLAQKYYQLALDRVSDSEIRSQIKGQMQ